MKLIKKIAFALSLAAILGATASCITIIREKPSKGQPNSITTKKAPAPPANGRSTINTAPEKKDSQGRTTKAK